MLKIGEFSKLCYVSVRMLRHFEEMGLLLPERVDPFTGYRYYTAAQLTTVSTIVSLQRMGLSLTAIGEILESGSGSQALETHIEACYRKKLKEAEKLQVQLRQLKTAGERLRRKEETMKNYTVIAKELPSCQVASLRDTLSTYTEEGRLWGQLYAEIAPQHAKFTTPPFNTATYHDAEYNETNPDVEVQAAVLGTYQDTGHVTFKTLPARLVASVTFTGDYDQITGVNIAAMHWIEENGYRTNGTMFNVYHVGPGDTSDSEKWVTECCFPIAKK
ncbi:MerR family transcriptional regulator [Eubacterium sp. 1001713B170207_170306_E7]|uniref:MerR family transcriptional regulator n=1 Tax=Eubacterium sp. 1001713B170207_170306_E7 TaxID=2787097 RepID=UPI0018987DD5|nr:MerR family transcriptional regulator [Eubacterium sp. 1001713B170207_170306_E7]